MKKATSILLALCMVFSLTAGLSSCGKKTNNTPKTVKEKLQGNTYILGDVTKGGVSVKNDFTGFSISFTGDGGQVTIKSGGTSSATFTGGCTINTDNITLTAPPTSWKSTLTSVSSSAADAVPGTELHFTAVITNAKIGDETYKFDLVKQ
jgi:hypothetical protein